MITFRKTRFFLKKPKNVSKNFLIFLSIFQICCNLVKEIFSILVQVVNLRKQRSWRVDDFPSILKNGHEQRILNIVTLCTFAEWFPPKLLYLTPKCSPRTVLRHKAGINFGPSHLAART